MATLKPRQAKETVEVLNLRRKYKVMAKLQEYLEAHEMQQKVFQLKNKEEGKWEKVKI